MTPIRFPSPTRYSTPDKFHDALYRWLCRITGRHLYFSIYKERRPLPDLEELTEWLREESWERIRPWIPDYNESRSKHSFDFDWQTERAAAFCLSEYDGPGVEAKARRNGQRSKRGSVRPLIEIIELEGLSVSEQATRLGVSERTVKRYRAATKGVDPVLLAPKGKTPPRAAPLPIHPLLEGEEAAHEAA